MRQCDGGAPHPAAPDRASNDLPGSTRKSALKPPSAVSVLSPGQPSMRAADGDGRGGLSLDPQGERLVVHRTAPCLLPGAYTVRVCAINSKQTWTIQETLDMMPA